MAFIYDMADTWNAGGTTFTAIKMNVTDTASASDSKLLDLQVGGTSQAHVGKGGAYKGTSFQTGAAGVFNGIAIDASDIYALSNSRIGWVDNTTQSFVYDLTLFRDAANVLGQRNSTNAQTFNIYNTYTNGSTYERASAVWSGNTFNIRTEHANGTNRDITISAANVLSLQAGGTSGPFWQINTSGHFLATGADNTYDIGASGATRPRTGYFGTSVFVGTPGIFSGSGSPESVVTAPTGSIYLNTAGGTDTTLYTKNSGSGNTGWVAVDNV